MTPSGQSQDHTVNMASSSTQEAPQSTMLVLNVCLCRVCVYVCLCSACMCVSPSVIASQDDTNKSLLLEGVFSRDIQLYDSYRELLPA